MVKYRGILNGFSLSSAGLFRFSPLAFLFFLSYKVVLSSVQVLFLNRMFFIL